MLLLDQVESAQQDLIPHELSGLIPPAFTACMFTALAATLAGMDSSDLTPAQAAELREHVRPMLHYLTRLRTRMDRRHFPPNDPLRLKVQAAVNALHALHVDLHYRSCEGRAG